MNKLWIKKCTLENFGKIGSLRLDDLAGINLIIGENGTGKTFLLKALYSAIRTMEEYKRGDANRSVNDILIDKLRWTFQVDKPGDIVT
jgi:AAA15 family ATPase/GTPase